MELTSPQQSVLKINSKKGYILVDPEATEEARIVILSDSSSKEFQQTEENLIIYGPGDFEAGGILIKGVRNDSETIYSIDTGEGRVLLVQSTSLSKLADEDEYDAVIIKTVSPIEESVLSAISSNTVVVYGDAANIPEVIKTQRTSKLNLKKKDELTSNIVFLEKK